MSNEGNRLSEALTAVYEPYVRALLAKRVEDEPTGLDDVIEEGRGWLEEALSDLLSLPYSMQDRGPLELFQEAMRFPTTALRQAGHLPVERDVTARNALPGDLYDLAPTSSGDLGERVWQAHLAWGAAKAAAMSRRRAGLLTRNLMDRSKLEGGLKSAGWVVLPMKGEELPAALNGVVVDLEHPVAFQVIEAVATMGTIRCLAYGPHVDAAAFRKARRLGADEILARSVVFRDTSAVATRLSRGNG